MPHRRPVKHGSFGGHFDELVKHFWRQPPKRTPKTIENRKLQDKRDIHALLFERAWAMDRRQSGGEN